MSFAHVLRRPRLERPPTHVVFDHDGTLSTVRYGWEKVMEPMMVTAIVGNNVLPQEHLADIRHWVREFIDRTTGIQTIAQMQGLVAMVRQRGLNETVLDAAGYKEIYNNALMTFVNRRLQPLLDGHLVPADLEVKNATRLVNFLKGQGVHLHLASGTDQDDVEREARLMGYGRYFETIYGSVGKVEVEAKSVILTRLFAELEQDASIVVIGDGPVEIHEGTKVGAFTIGVISDEVRRHGPNPAKTRRLQEAGADALIPDFSDFPAVLSLLGFV